MSGQTGAHPTRDESELAVPTLILVTGAPGTGKTTLATHLGDALALPVLSRDILKEHLADALGDSVQVTTRQLSSIHPRLDYHGGRHRDQRLARIAHKPVAAGGDKAIMASGRTK